MVWSYSRPAWTPFANTRQPFGSTDTRFQSWAKNRSPGVYRAARYGLTRTESFVTRNSFDPSLPTTLLSGPVGRLRPNPAARLNSFPRTRSPLNTRFRFPNSVARLVTPSSPRVGSRVDANGTRTSTDVHRSKKVYSIPGENRVT